MNTPVPEIKREIEKLNINFGYLPIDPSLSRCLENLQDKINEIIDELERKAEEV